MVGENERVERLMKRLSERVSCMEDVMSQDKKLKPFGEIPESFKGLKDEGVYYVDKTGFIPYLISQKRKICVVTRPRRFGKTLMLRTLQTFFEYRLDDDGKPIDNRRYFEGLKVMDAGDEVLREMGRYPVIFLSLKDVSGDTYEGELGMMRKAVYDACQPHLSQLLDNPALLEEERAQFRRYAGKQACEEELQSFLGDMCIWLNRITKRKVVILLDEYDVPLQQAAIYDNHHPGTDLFEKTAHLIDRFVSSGFKTNINLAYGIIAGCMRVAKESIFTGMNNPGVITVVDEIPDEFWGFTQKEVETMLAYYDLSDQMDALKHWYEGYSYSGREVYNPWSLLNAIRGLVNGYGEKAIQSYWVRTSGNAIIDEMIDNNPDHRQKLADIMNGEPLWAPIIQDLSYRDLKKRPDVIWSFLLYTGYLKSIEMRQMDTGSWEALMTIPNMEIRSVMNQAMEHWWKDICIPGMNAKTLMNALWDGDIDTIEGELYNFLTKCVSVFDFNESFYHGMMVGLLTTVCSNLKSNRESGDGRPDIEMIDRRRAMILELKCVTSRELEQALKENKDTEAEYVVNACMDVKLDEAERQIHDKKYAQGIRIEYGVKTVVTAYAICFCRKQCMVRAVGDSDV